jgi:CheY-like chemotaxis protein
MDAREAHSWRRCAVVPRVLMVQRDLYFDGPDLEDIEPAVAVDGETALACLRRERFDAVLLDLRLEPLDGWCVLAAVGGWPEKPRLIAVVGERGDIDRALHLGADLCVMAGTQLHARALQRSTPAMRPETTLGREEMQCPQSRRTSFPRPTTSGVRV